MADDLTLRRIIAEFREMPGTTLTVAQAARLWALDRHVVEEALSQLERDGNLKRTAQGTYLLRERA